MRERIARLIGGKVEGKLVLGTFHSICRRYLVNYGYLIGLQRGFGIADSGDSLAIIRVCIVICYSVGYDRCLYHVFLVEDCPTVTTCYSA